jgi:hypothetical protein
VCQIVTTLSYPRTAPFEPANFLSVVEGWFLNTSSAVVFGTSAQISFLILNFDILPVILAAVPFFLVFVYLLVKGSGQVRLLALTFVGASTGIWCAATVLNFSEAFDYSTFDADQWHDFLLGRYSTVPSMFLLALLPLLAAGLEKVSAVAVSAVVAGMMVLQLLYFFPSSAFRHGGPLWATGVSAARDACRADPTKFEHPVGTAPGAWKVQVPCVDLRP